MLYVCTVSMLYVLYTVCTVLGRVGGGKARGDREREIEETYKLAHCFFVQGDAETHTSLYIGPVGSLHRVHRVKLRLVFAHLNGDLYDFTPRRFSRLFCLLC